MPRGGDKGSSRADDKGCAPLLSRPARVPPPPAAPPPPPTRASPPAPPLSRAAVPPRASLGGSPPPARISPTPFRRPERFEKLPLQSSSPPKGRPSASVSLSPPPAPVEPPATPNFADMSEEDARVAVASEVVRAQTRAIAAAFERHTSNRRESEPIETRVTSSHRGIYRSYGDPPASRLSKLASGGGGHGGAMGDGMQSWSTCQPADREEGVQRPAWGERLAMIMSGGTTYSSRARSVHSYAPKQCDCRACQSRPGHWIESPCPQIRVQVRLTLHPPHGFSFCLGLALAPPP